MSKIGFIGLGIMGAPMAGHLLDGGHELFAYDRKPLPEALAGKRIVAVPPDDLLGRRDAGRLGRRPRHRARPGCRPRRHAR